MVEMKDRLYRRCSNYALSKFIVDNGPEDLWRRENQDSSKFTHFNRSPGARSRIDSVFTDIRIVNNTKINNMVSYANHYDAISVDILPTKTKIGKDSWYLILFYVSPSSPQLQRFRLFIKTQSLLSEWHVGILQISF